VTILNSYLELEIGRAAAGGAANGNHRRLRGSPTGSLVTTKHEADYASLAAAGRIYTAQFGVVTNAVASVTDIPTTGGHFCLYNGASASGVAPISLHILSVGWASASGTVGIGAFAVGGVSGLAQASAVTTTAGNIIKSTSGSTRATSATADSTLTLTSQPAWAILGNYNGVSGVGIGFGSVLETKGMFIVPPTFVFALAIVSPTGTSPAFLASITYAEVETDAYV
jgi:hypothetical protein